MSPTPLANLRSVTDTLPAIPSPARPRPHGARKRPWILASSSVSPCTTAASAAQRASRRTALGLGLASVALAGTFEDSAVLAEDNGYWIIGPIPVPPIYNKIANEATGTRSFVRNGIYIANIGEEGSRYRIRKNAFDLLALGDLIQKDLLNYVRRYLRFKGTIMYYDFDKVISSAPESEKESLLDLANRLFDRLEKLEDATKRDDFEATEAVYKDTAVLLEEVRDEIKYQSVGFLGAIGLWNLNLLESGNEDGNTTDEELKLRLYSGEHSRLGPADRFLKTLVDIPFAFKRIEALIFMTTLQEEVTITKESFATLELNGTDGKTTLLHFVVQEIIRSEGMRAARVVREIQSFSSMESDNLQNDVPNEPEDFYGDLGLQVVSGLSSELENVQKAATVYADSLTGSVGKLGQWLAKTRQFLNSKMKNSEEESGFHRTC